MTTLPPIHAIATIIEHEGGPVIIAAETIERLKSYLTDQECEGYPEAQHVSIKLGPVATAETPTK